MPDAVQRALVQQVRDVTELHARLQDLHDFAEQRGVELVAAARLPGSTKAIVVRVGDQASGEELARLIAASPAAVARSKAN